MLRRFCYAVVLLALAGPALAQPKTVLPVARDGPLDNLVPVPVADARAVALSEPLGLLAFCHDRNYPDAQVSLVRLDAKGNPAAYATAWKLPRPKALEKWSTYALAAAFHPRLPLLYVWQDIALPYNNPPPPVPADVKDFDHLLTYNVAKNPPELVAGLCRGPEYLYGQGGGGLAVDPAGQHLYVPNLRDPKNAGSFRFGRFRLDAEGLLRLDDKEPKLPAAARLSALAARNAAGTIVPPQMTPIEYVYLFAFSPYGAGNSFDFLAPDVVVAGSYTGVIAWRPEDKVVTLGALPLKGYGNTLLARHPSLPVLYATQAVSDSIFCLGHSEGHLTLLPHQYVFPGASLGSPPALLAKGRRLAVGGQHQVYVTGLDEQGRPAGPLTRVRVLNPQVRALVYSPRFDRLYVGVEVSK